MGADQTLPLFMFVFLWLQLDVGRSNTASVSVCFYVNGLRKLHSMDILKMLTKIRLIRNDFS